MLILRDIHKHFDAQPVLSGVSLTLQAGEIVVLLGPSGCGKTTLLRIIAGLETANEGELLLDGRDLAQLPVHKRGFGFVFQDYALFPHKDVFHNVAFGLRMLRWPPARIVERVTQVLHLVGLHGFEKRPIHELSGGEQQRIALARSLAPAPRLLLLDEPLGALDRALRERLMLELRLILKQAGGLLGRPEGIATIYVTHDQAEAFAIADRVIVMNAGRIEQEGTPLQLHRGPATPFVARFLGMENILEGEVVSSAPCLIRTRLGDLEVANADVAAGHKVTLLIRPEAGQLAARGEGQPNCIMGEVRAVSFRGRYQYATVAVSAPGSGDVVSLKLEFESSIQLPSPGEDIVLTLDSQALTLLEGG